MDEKPLATEMHVGVIGCGSMGSGLALLFAENHSAVTIFDKSPEMVEAVMKRAAKDPKVSTMMLTPVNTLQDFVGSFKRFGSQPCVVILSLLPHGPVIDKVLQDLAPLLQKGDIILDGANEWWEESERRQRWLKEEFGVHLLACGVSGGYQSARRGPSMSPSGDPKAYAVVEPLLKIWAAKTKNGTPCVSYIGPGGSGHFVKMLHNGIEQGMLSVTCEAYALLRKNMGLENDEIASVFENWTTSGELKGTYLLQIGSEALRFKRGDSIRDSRGIVDDIEDKVTQDVDNSEGTGVWTMKAFASHHVAAPTLAAAHNLRILSSNKDERKMITGNMNLPSNSPRRINTGNESKGAFVEKLRMAVYGSYLASFVQGCNVIARASKDRGWDISIAKCIQIWRAGCIIQSDGIADLLEPVYAATPDCPNVLLSKEVAKELSKTFSSLKEIVLLSTQVNAVIPALSASLEYIKAVASDDLPTNFEEAELDYFGHHNYDVKQEGEGAPKKGSHHTEWKPA